MHYSYENHKDENERLLKAFISSDSVLGRKKGHTFANENENLCICKDAHQGVHNSNYDIYCFTIVSGNEGVKG